MFYFLTLFCTGPDPTICTPIPQGMVGIMSGSIVVVELALFYVSLVLVQVLQGHQYMMLQAAQTAGIFTVDFVTYCLSARVVMAMYGGRDRLVRLSLSAPWGHLFCVFYSPPPWSHPQCKLFNG